MLRVIATDRTPLQLAPEPIRMLVLSVYAAATPGSAPDDSELDSSEVVATSEARISAIVGDAEPTVHLVRVGDRIEIGSRHFLVTAMQETGPLGSCVELDQVPPPVAQV
jgi:hypothetical protein